MPTPTQARALAQAQTVDPCMCWPLLGSTLRALLATLLIVPLLILLLVLLVLFLRPVLDPALVV